MANIIREQSEIERDEASRFAGMHYMSVGFFPHFHRNIEIYGVVKGSVVITIAEQKRVLTDGQIAVVNSLENHSYEIDGKAEIFFLHIGTRYLTNLATVYPKKRLPRWLLDEQYNQRIFRRVLEVLDEKEPLSELRRIGVACQLFADIVDHYGATDEKHMPRQDSEIVTEIVQYIYDHYQENITLESLGKVFYMSPKVLSNKLKKRLNVDLRVFVNDIRVQMVIQLRNDPQYKDKTLQQIATSCGFNCMSTFYRSYERNYSFQELSNEPKKTTE